MGQGTSKQQSTTTITQCLLIENENIVDKSTISYDELIKAIKSARRVEIRLYS